MSGWPTVAFTDVVRDVSGGNVKVPQREYLPDGLVPVVDQGRELTGGYTDATSALCKAELPVVIFGDHTRVLKLVDFPFAIGADGVKVLKPSDALDERFLYHYLRFVDIPSAGYDRHFKYLKRLEVPLPPIEEQRRIAAILDHADALRAKRREALARLDELTQSIFVDMFGNPANNSKGLELVAIGDLLDSAQYGTSEKSGAEGEYAVLRMNNITYQGQIDLTDLKYTDLPDGKVERFTVRAGDLLFNRTNSAELVGKTAVYRGERLMAYAGYLVRLRVADGNSPEYISAFLNSRYGKAVLRGMCKSIVGMANINAKEVQSIRIPRALGPAQKQFEQRVAAVEASKVGHRTALAELDALFASLQSRAFRGEL